MRLFSIMRLSKWDAFGSLLLGLTGTDILLVN